MTKIHIPDMSCGHCKASIEGALAPLTSGATIDLPSRSVTLPPKQDLPAILAALSDIGFPAEIISD